MTVVVNPEPHVARVIPDIDAVSGEFDYEIPNSWHEDKRINQIQIGTIVRFRFRNRIVRGWVSDINPDDVTERQLLPLKQISGIGPTTEIIKLARWAARHWHGPTARFLRIASPKTMIRTIHESGNQPKPRSTQGVESYTSKGFSSTVITIPPTGDRWPCILETVSNGNALILVPSLNQARLLVGRLKKLGIPVGLHGKEWLLGARGATIVGTRSAAFASIKNLSSILMIDEHDEVYENEAAPTWHAREVVLERAKRLEIPVTFTSPIPTPEIRECSQIQNVGTEQEKSGWGTIKIIDPRVDRAARGGLWPRVTVDAIKNSDRAVIILNRKGRSKLLACATCNELVTCSECGSGMQQPDENHLRCARNGHERPISCRHCLSTRLKNLRVGVTKAVEELGHLLQINVQEVQADTKDLNLDSNQVFLGTKAALHRIDWADLVVFADFDQDLFAKGYRSEEMALGSVIRAVRITNTIGRSAGSVVIQTRSPQNQLVEVVKNNDIKKWSEMQTSRRALLALPPFGSYATISGPGAEDYVERLPMSERLEILGPSEGSWIIKSGFHDDLLNALSKTTRPQKRLRIAVNALNG